MESLKRHRIRMVIWIVLGIVAVIAVAIVVFMNQPSFGRIPRGERLERIKRSPHYKDGQFRNLHETVMMTSDKGRVGTMIDFLFRKTERLRPDKPVPCLLYTSRNCNGNFGIIGYILRWNFRMNFSK